MTRGASQWWLAPRLLRLHAPCCPPTFVMNLGRLSQRTSTFLDNAARMEG
jgi:hypothetical protein